jgi:hypothetical protein
MSEVSSLTTTSHGFAHLLRSSSVTGTQDNPAMGSLGGMPDALPSRSLASIRRFDRGSPIPLGLLRNPRFIIAMRQTCLRTRIPHSLVLCTFATPNCVLYPLVVPTQFKKRTVAPPLFHDSSMNDDFNDEVCSQRSKSVRRFFAHFVAKFRLKKIPSVRLLRKFSLPISKNFEKALEEAYFDSILPYVLL